MTVLDAYAVIAYLRGEDAASEVAEMLRGDAMLSAANAAEVVDQLVRIWGRDDDDVEGDLALLGHAGMWIHPLDAELALHAGRLRARHYHRKDCAGRRVGTSPACPTALVGDPDEPHGDARVRRTAGA